MAILKHIFFWFLKTPKLCFEKYPGDIRMVAMDQKLKEWIFVICIY